MRGKHRSRQVQDSHPLDSLADGLWRDLSWRRRRRLDRESFRAGVIEGCELFTEATLYEEAHR